MMVHFSLQLGHAVDHLRQRGFVAFGQLLHTLGKLLTDTIHLAVDGGIERGEPFVVNDQRLDFGLGELGVMGIGLRIEFGLGVLKALLEIRLVGIKLQPFV